jgi:hypothetical protein
VGTPSPGTPNNQIGDWNCASQQGAATGALNVRMSVSNVPGANHFGGTFTLLRNVNTSIWRVLVQPGEDGIAEVARSWQSLMTNQWPGGRSNFDFNLVGANVGPRINAYLAPNGAVSQTEGCVNPTGTVGVGKTFELGKLILGLGSNCGTPPTPKPPTSEWGFRLTTGDIEGSDPWPFVEVTTAAPPGTALLPNVKTRTPGQGFFFTRMGMDSTTGATRRNIVLVSGGVGRDPISGNLFFRITDLRMELLLPEPAMGLGLVVGAMALAALARRERR